MDQFELKINLLTGNYTSIVNWLKDEGITTKKDAFNKIYKTAEGISTESKLSSIESSLGALEYSVSGILNRFED